jgi:transcriptional regulator with XRE-family HTH domain
MLISGLPERADMTLGKVIRDKRKKLEISQKQLAEKVTKEDGESISPQYLNDIELERRSPPDYILDQFATLLELPRDDLYLLAGQLPSDLRPGEYDPPRFRAAFKAFRREMKKDRG